MCRGRHRVTAARDPREARAAQRSRHPRWRAKSGRKRLQLRLGFVDRTAQRGPLVLGTAPICFMSAVSSPLGPTKRALAASNSGRARSAANSARALFNKAESWSCIVKKNEKDGPITRPVPNETAWKAEGERNLRNVEGEARQVQLGASRRPLWLFNATLAFCTKERMRSRHEPPGQPGPCGRARCRRPSCLDESAVADARIAAAALTRTIQRPRQSAFFFFRAA